MPKNPKGRSPNFERQAERFRRSGAVHNVSVPLRSEGQPTDGMPLEQTFDLAYTRAGSRDSAPLVMIPGGPGMAAILPYFALRKAAVRKGFQVIMIEPRGVGFSRRQRDGSDLELGHLTLDAAAHDIAAVLDAEDIDRAIIWGTSYGGHVAQTFGALHPGRVSGMVLDSTWSVPDDFRIARDEVRRRLLWGQDDSTELVAAELGKAVADSVLGADAGGEVPRIAYEIGGSQLLLRMLSAIRDGVWEQWRWLENLAENELESSTPYVMEFDLVGAINQREITDLEPDGLPLDPAPSFHKARERFGTFRGAPRDLVAESQNFDWPTAVISGGRDLRTVRETNSGIARRLRNGVLVPLENMGHSAMDNHPSAGLSIAKAVSVGAHHQLPDIASVYDGWPVRTMRRTLAPMLSSWIAWSRLIKRLTPAVR